MIALYPGTFDPITNGHFEIIRRASTIFQVLVVGVAISDEKKPLFEHEKRLAMVNEVLNAFSNIEVQPYDGLTIDFAKSVKADIIFRGLRSGVDFEYEKPIAETNQLLNPSINTVFLLTHKEFGMISSSIVREIINP